MHHSLRVPAEPASVPRVRHFLRATLAGDRRPFADDAVLLTSELVTNAVVHAQTAVDVEIDVDAERVTVLVRDFGGGVPVLLDPPPEADRGRGLAMVDALARQWGVEVDDASKAVWFTIALRDDRGDGTRRNVLLERTAPLDLAGEDGDRW
jgi:anti-sigma regulatory factor (Ser/Thr protein kinase)